MKKQHYEIIINEDVKKVWHTMLDDATYRIWTKVFNEGGSWYEGKWETGAEMKFMGPDPSSGEVGGMYSRIAEAHPYEFVSIEHLGMLKNGVVDTTSDEVKKWTPAFENYTFTEVGNSTHLGVDIDLNEEYITEFDQMWPKALEALKELAEK